ncbi:MAG TPA: type II secretion system minor pseudopilin GspK [Allosphingosinicella sp.]|nr:type II secretion system minor pseudopilin GspK [Allosphingosinicella sp.]
MNGGRPVAPRERGAALLAVLLLVAVMGALSAAALERLRLSTALAVNGAALDQARAFAVGVEALLALRVDDLISASPERTTLAGGWNGETRQLPLPGGALAQATIRDGGNCFNINSVAQGEPPAMLVARPAGVAQFVALMRLREVPEPAARRIAEAAADWVDADAAAAGQGAEDPVYAGLAQPYRAGNTLFAEVSELRAVNGMTPEIYDRIRPWLCALPTTDLSPINVNTLLPGQALLLAMLAPDQIGPELARRAIAQRPAGGWEEMADFYAIPAFANVLLPLDVQLQPQLSTRWFTLDLRVELQGAELAETALVDARLAPARVVVRRWGSDD